MFLIGLLFIVIGVAFLLKTLGIITGNVWGIIGSLFLIVLGVSFMLKSRCKRSFFERFWKKE